MAEGKGHTELQPAYCFPIRASRKHLFVSDAQMRVIAEMADRPDREFWAKHIVAAVNTCPAVEGLVKALESVERGCTAVLLDAALSDAPDGFDECPINPKVLEQIVNDSRSALSRFRSLQKGGAK